MTDGGARKQFRALAAVYTDGRGKGKTMEQQYRYLAAQQAFRMYGARYGTRYADYIERQLEAKGYDPNDLSLGEVLAGRAREENDRAE